MHRFEILSHTPQPTDEDKMAEAATCALSVNGQDQESDPAKEFICEIEFIKSRVITLSSCDETYKERSRDIQYKSCGQQDPCNYGGDLTNGSSETIKKTAAVSNEQIGPPKTRRFRRISLPHWLHKSSKKFSRDELRGRWTTGSRKRRMMRTNSAPKTLGADARDKKLTSEEFRLTTEKLEKAQLQGKGERNTGKTRAARRISLPAHVSLDTGVPLGYEERLVSADKPARKYTMPPLRMAENGELDILRRSLLQSSVTAALDAPGAIKPTEEGVNKQERDKQERLPDRASSFSAVQEIISESRNANSHPETVKQKRLIVSPKLRRFKKPDMFYIPLPVDGDDNIVNGNEKIANVMCRARRIEPSSNQHQEAIHEIIEYQLQSYLRQRVFMARCSQQWCLDLSQAIKVRVQNLREEYKVVCVVYIAAVRGQGLHAAVECTWSPKDDNFVVASYKNRSLFAIASVLVLKYN